MSQSTATAAFVETFDLPPTTSGALDGLTFAVKDLFDIAGHRTGAGNPTWRATHRPAVCHAVCVEQLLAAGAHCRGKTITDQLAFSLLGENYFDGTPLNPKAPDRMPGGSSSGSASAVAAGTVDFALGTDTGGSVRVPASNCGILGWRPSHGRISVAGLMPFAPSLDTVGVFTQNAEVLRRIAEVLLGATGANLGVEPPTRTYLLDDGFRLADAEVTQALAPTVDRLRQTSAIQVETIALEHILKRPVPDLIPWFENYRTIQACEAWSCLGAWVEEHRPEFGPFMTDSMTMIRNYDRRQLPAAIAFREAFARTMHAFLGATAVLILPTTPTLALPKGTIVRRDAGPEGYYARTLGYTGLAGLARLPQVSLPVGEVQGVPIGLSVIGSWWRDEILLAWAERFAGQAVA